MNTNELAIATMTWARDEAEEKLLRHSLKILSDLNIPIFITDGGSNESLINYMQGLPLVTISKAESKGLYNQVTSSLSAAYKKGFKYILYTEPDKSDFFKDHLEIMLNDITVNETTGIITASRSKEAFSTFPSFQQMSETTINKCCAEVIQQPIDFTYGPFILNSKLVSYLGGLKNNIDWGWRPYIFCIAHRLGYIVQEYKGNFACPEDQRQDDSKERIYRMKQLAQNIEGVVLAATKQL